MTFSADTVWLLQACVADSLAAMMACYWKSMYQELKEVKPLSANFIKWSNTLKKFEGKLPTNCLSAFDHFKGLALKGLMPGTWMSEVWLWKVTKAFNIVWNRSCKFAFWQEKLNEILNAHGCGKDWYLTSWTKYTDKEPCHL